GLTVARVGANGATARRWGVDTVSARVKGVLARPQFGGEPVEVKLLAEKGSGRLVGAQFVGGRGAGRMADRAALAIGEGVPLERLALSETVYSPTLNVTYDAFSQAVDRLLAVGGWG
ncbi:MAG: hypothetical protein ACYDA8_15015, partial [Deferrisomatales bacterium]